MTEPGDRELLIMQLQSGCSSYYSGRQPSRRAESRVTESVTLPSDSSISPLSARRGSTVTGPLI